MTLLPGMMCIWPIIIAESVFILTLIFSFDTSNAIVVQDKDSAAIEGTITTATNSFQYDFTNNVQRGAASAGEPAPITVVFQGLGDSEWNYAQFTIQQATGQSFACNTSDELNYSNPA